MHPAKKYSDDSPLLTLPNEIQEIILIKLNKTKKKETPLLICKQTYKIALDAIKSLKFAESEDIDVSKLSDLKHVKHIKFSKFFPKNFEFLPELFPNIESITMRKFPFQNDLEPLSYLQKLAYLDCSSCSLNDQAAALLPRLTNLRKLLLPGGIKRAISEEGLNYLLELPKLEELSLSSNKNMTEGGLKKLSNLASLTKLDLSHCKKITDSGLEHLIKLENLSSLNLKGCNHITDEGLKHIARLKNLTSLNLSCCRQISNSGLSHLSELRLKKLDLSKCGISGTGLSDLNTTDLEYLNLSDCEVTDENLENLLRFKQLKHLKLRGALITENALKAFTELKNLTTLNLFYCSQISEGGLKQLADLSNLQKLKVSGCCDEDLKDIAVHRNLKKLEIKSSLRVTKIGLQELSKLLKLKKLGLRFCALIKNEDLIPILQLTQSISSLDLGDCTQIKTNLGLIEFLSKFSELKKLRLPRPLEKGVELMLPLSLKISGKTR